VDRLTQFLVRRCRLTALLTLLTLAVPICFLPRASIDNSIEVWLGRSSPQAHRYQEFLRRYGTEEFVVIAARMDDPLSETAMAWQNNLADRLGQLEGVAQVLCLPKLAAALTVLAPSRATRLAEDPLARNLLISADGHTAGIVAWVKPSAGPQDRRRTVEGIERVAKAAARPGVDLPLVGTPLMNAHLDLASARDAALLLPVAAAVSILSLLLMLRNLWQVLACFVAVGGTVLWAVGLMAMSGRPFNMVTVTLPSLLFVLSISPGLHIASRTAGKLHLFSDHRQALTEAIRELLLPILMSCLTTVAGFASLMITDMDPVFDLGLFAAAGMLISLVLSILIVPGLLDLFPKPAARLNEPPRPHFTAPMGTWVTRRCKLVVAASVAASILCILTFWHIRSENNVVKFFPPQSTIAGDYAFVGKNLTGLYTLELDIQAPLDRQKETVQAIRRLSDHLASRGDVARVDHYGEFEPLLSSGRVLAWLPGAAQATGPLKEAASRFRHVEGARVWLRVSILVRSMDSGEFYSLLSAVRQKSRELLPEWASCEITGAVLLLNEAQRLLVRTQVQSFSFAALTVLVMIGVSFVSWRAGLAAAVPNLLPVFSTFAIMSLAGIPINPATVMIASVAIGLAADDAIHYLACYRRWRRRSLSPPEAAYASLAQAGQAMAYSSIIAAAGFFVLVLAQFRPLAHFGLLTGSTLLVALVSDMLVMPAWAALTRLWESR
jgi:uncharacterized protein